MHHWFVTHLIALALTGCTTTGKSSPVIADPDASSVSPDEGGEDPNPTASDTGPTEDTDDTGAETAEDTGIETDDTGSGTADDSGPDDPTPAPDYSVPGPHNAGLLTDDFTTGDAITLWVDVWYPAVGAGSGTADYYGGPGWVLTGTAVQDAEAMCDSPRPVMVHSHGSNSIRWEMFYLMEHLASHGWLIAAPDHAGNTYYDTWGSFDLIYQRRPRDIAAAFDWLLSQSADPSSPLAGCIDASDGYVASGYSFGGYTAYAVGGASVIGASETADPRATAVVTHAPWNAYGVISEGTGGIDVPVLTIGGERDDVVGTQYVGLHEAIESTPRAIASFFDGGHFSPASIYCGAPGDGCGDDYIASETYNSIVQTSVLAFIETLRGVDGAWEQLVENPAELSWETVRE
jgi:hypothetical protein